MHRYIEQIPCGVRVHMRLTKKQPSSALQENLPTPEEKPKPILIKNTNKVQMVVLPQRIYSFEEILKQMIKAKLRNFIQKNKNLFKRK